MHPRTMQHPRGYPPTMKAEAERNALDPQGETTGNALGEPPG